MTTTAHGPEDFAEAAAGLRTAGAVLIRSLFSADLMDRLAVELDQAAAREAKEYGAAFLSSIGQAGYVSDLLRIGPAISELLSHQRLQRLMTDVFGETPRLFGAQGIILAPGDGRGIWPRRWHADMFKSARSFDTGFVFAVNCLLFLDDVDQTNGGTVVLEGSHRVSSIISDDAYLEDRALTVSGPKGSAVLIEGGAWHAAGMNRSTMPRRAIKLMFSRRWIRPEIDYTATVPGMELPAYVRRLLDVGP